MFLFFLADEGDSVLRLYFIRENGKQNKNKWLQCHDHPLESFFGCKGEEMIWLLRVNCFFLLLSKKWNKKIEKEKKDQTAIWTNAGCLYDSRERFFFLSFLSYPVSQPWGWNGTCSFACVRACVCASLRERERKRKRKRGSMSSTNLHFFFFFPL